MTFIIRGQSEFTVQAIVCLVDEDEPGGKDNNVGDTIQGFKEDVG